MSKKNGKDYLYLIWKSTSEHRQYIVGQLTKNGKFEFCYGIQIEDAMSAGFKPLVSFPDITKTYYSECLFPAFSSRLPDKKRPDIETILERYDLKEYDEYNLLKKSGARLPIDTMEFIDPVFYVDEPFSRRFFIAGPRHYMSCKGDECKSRGIITRGDELFLERDFNNSYDEYAVRIVNKDRELLGFVPRYYSEAVAGIIDANKEYHCYVWMVSNEEICDECIKVELNVP